MNASKLLRTVLRNSQAFIWKPFTINNVNCRLQVHTQTQINLTNSVLHYTGFRNASFINQGSQATARLHTSVRRWAFDEVETGEEFCMAYKELKNAVDDDNVQIIDVRRPDEVEAGHIPAKRFIHIPVQDLAEALQMSEEEFRNQYGVDKPSKDASDIVFNCKVGGRSTFAVRIARSVGYSKARHYPGGWTEWNEESR